jgi:aspartyl/asparaginyl beta-hydroxylase (cupin superfamily)
MPSLKELESRAFALSQQGDIQATARVCKDILAIDGNHLSSLRFLADLAIQSGDFASATSHLQTLLVHSPRDTQLLSQLGQAFYRQGKLLQAAAIYTDYWRSSPRNRTIYLTLGCLHVELGNFDKAAQIFSLGESVDPQLLSLWKKPGVNPGIGQMSKIAWDTLCRHHTELHIKTVEALGDPQDIARIRDAVWPLADAREISYGHPLHCPQGFSIEYAESPTFFEAALFPWRRQLEGCYPDIREEILTGMNVAVNGRPYLSNRHRLEGPQWEPLVNNMSWASVHLYGRGLANQQVIDRFPQTLEALARVPLATSGAYPSEVFISVLAPHTRIPEHFGVSSAILTAHLPIEVPAGCGLKVHEETRVPEAGKLMVFDDTWEHSAWNNSDQPRVVLIFELWHPQLSELERSAVSHGFRAREQWIQQRSVDWQSP